MKTMNLNRSVLAGLALALCFGPTDLRAAAGDLYVADTSNGAIFNYAPGGARSTFATGLTQPVAVAFDRKGNLFVANSGSGTIQMESTIFKFAPDGTRTTFANLGLSMPLSMAFDGASNLFVSNSLDILKFSPGGRQSTFASNVDGVWALASDKFGNLYAASRNFIVKFTPDGSSSTFATLSDPGGSTTALAFDAEGSLFAKRDNAILKISSDGSSSTTFASGDFQANSLAFDAENRLFAGLNAFNSGEPGIVKFAPNGTRTTFAFGPLYPTGLAFGPVTEKLRNISARGLVGTGDNVLIGGFIVGGNALANNAVVVRAIGPSLAQAGVSAPLADPTLELHNSTGAVIVSNNDWQDTQKEQIMATGLAPTNPNESAIYATLPAGSYTAVVHGGNNTTGNALVEVYAVAK